MRGLTPYWFSHYPLRSLLAAAGVAAGVCLMVAVADLVGALYLTLTENLRRMGSNVLIVSKRPQTFGVADTAPLTFADAEEIEHSAREVAQVAPVFSIQGLVEGCGEKRIVQLTGAIPEHSYVEGWEVAVGRFVTQPDLAARARVVVLGADLADSMPCVRTSPWVRITGEPFRVIGLLRAKGALLGAPRDSVAFIPITTASARYGPRLAGSISILLRVRAGAPATAARGEIRRILRRSRGLDAVDDDFDIQSPSDIQAAFGGIANSIVSLLLGLLSTSLVVAGFGIFNTVYAGVVQRTPEIGLRRAIGATRKMIALGFMLEALAIAGAGALTGTLAGVVVGAAIGAVARLQFFLHGPAALAAVLLSIVTGLLAGTWPAIHAATIPPYEALRHE